MMKVFGMNIMSKGEKSMVIREEITIGTKQFIRNYSDEGFYIERDGIDYEEAIDPIPEANDREYIETDKPIEDVSDEDDEAVTE